LATFGHITPERCAQLAEELTNAFLRWEKIGRRDAPQYLTYRVTDPHGRLWSIGPATSNQITPSKPASMWQARCSAPFHQTPVLSARAVVARIRDLPA
jgi:hypothetical protein